MEAASVLLICANTLQVQHSSAHAVEPEVSTSEDQGQLPMPAQGSAPRMSKVSNQSSIPSSLSQSSEVPAIQHQPEAEEHVAVVHHESIPEILPIRTSNKSRKVMLQPPLASETQLSHESF